MGLLNGRILAFLNGLCVFCLVPLLMGATPVLTPVSSASPLPLASPLPTMATDTPAAEMVLDDVTLHLYLPLVRSDWLPLLAGIYPASDIINQKTIDTEIKPLDAWVTGMAGGHSTSIVGTFVNMNISQADVYTFVEKPLTTAWDSGYATFINLPAPGTAFEVAAGKFDQDLIIWATSFKKFARNGERFAYIAPMQEMNGYWVPYNNDPANYQLAFRHIQAIFAQVGVPNQSVQWVFAPNGWTDQNAPMFEAYYPGNDVIDVVSFSAYNWGYCQGAVWEEPDTVFNNPALGPVYGHYLDRMRAMAPGKQIFIAETGSSSLIGPNGQRSAAEKDRWLRDAYSYLAAQKNVRAVMYFNFDKECDWTIYDAKTNQYGGYRAAVLASPYGYATPSQQRSMKK